MKAVIGLLMLGFGVAMAYIIGERMSTDAMAVVLGVAVGIVASIPTTVLLVALVRRSRQDSYYDAGANRQLPPQPQPPQIIIYDPRWAHHDYRGYADASRWQQRDDADRWDGR